ncbi:MAG: cellulose biosynthesis cyclic di-GMP-binding regulatory protein BcsB [Anaerolineales bacterium]|nr:cellulose biosynthesis cyclic di-GMP-binding regulatory protein BcsB [Anaerolineales bacterium]
MNNKAFNSVLIVILLLMSPFSFAGRAMGIPIQQGNGSSASVSFADLGYTDSNLNGPFDSTRKVFSVPTNWSLVSGGYVQLEFDVIFSGADIGRITPGGNTYAGLLTISYNSKIIGQIRLDQTGSQTRQILIPPEALQSVRENGQHMLDVRLDAQFDCLYDIRTNVLLKATSRFELPFEITTPELNLTKLPAPFYLSNSLLPDRSILVIPDSPSVSELQAALNVEAGFGSIVGRVFDFQMIPLSQLTNEQRSASHLIFVGTPDDFPLLHNVGFPSPVSNGQISGLPAQAVDDGVVELAISPWNSSKVVMLISGNSDNAVFKAATAVSSGKIFVYQNPTVVFVSDVQDLTTSIPVVEDFKLQDLGYENTVLQGIGVEEADYSFYVSKEQIATKDGEITLAYFHSGLLDYSLSSLTVTLNDQLIASQPFTEESEQLTYLPIKIPPGMLRYGENRLVVSAGLEPNLSCDLSGFSEPWLTVSDQTALHIPATEPTELNQTSLLDLKFYPAMFMSQSDLGDVAFILSENDPAGWKVAGDLAYSLGESATPIFPNITAAYASDVPDDVLKGNSLILVGKPDTLSILSELNDLLPAPFDFESNTVIEKQLQIVYRIPEGVNVGYLELLKSPYNPEAVVLVVSGNSDEGVAMAGIALIRDQLKDKLAGRFAVTNGIQVAVSSGPSHFSVIGTVLPSSSQIIATPLPNLQQNVNYAPPAWLMPLLISSGVIVLFLILFVAVRSMKARTQKVDDREKIQAASEDQK